MSRNRRALLLAFLALSITASAFAQIRTRRLGVNWREGVPRLSFSARDLISPRVRRELESGIVKHLVLTVQARREGGGAPIATRERFCSVRLDMWGDGGYLVALGRPRRRGQRPRTEHTAPNLRRVLEECLVVRDWRVGRPQDYERHRGRRLYFGVLAEFNPIVHNRCNALLPATGGASNPSGSFTMNIVRRRICEAERAIEFRSPPAEMP